MPVKHNGQSFSLPLIVTAGNGTALLGRDWLSTLQLDWKSILSVESSPSLQQVLDKHHEVFKEGLGKLQGIKARIYVYQNERPHSIIQPGSSICHPRQSGRGVREVASTRGYLPCSIRRLGCSGRSCAVTRQPCSPLWRLQDYY